MSVAKVKVTQEQIDTEYGEASQFLETGQSQYRGLSYEEGVMAVIDWMLGNLPDAPMSE